MTASRPVSERTDFFCIASGPSLTEADVAIVRRWRDANPADRKVIVTNNTIFMAPWADICYACDTMWWDRYYQGVSQLPPPRELVSFSESAKRKFQSITWEKRLYFTNSGAQAIHLATLRGARWIGLLGYDYQFTDGLTHWHGDHVFPLCNIKKFNMKEMYNLSLSLVNRDIEVVNYTRKTALKCFEQRAIDEHLDRGA